jgi:hypothetical protein
MQGNVILQRPWAAGTLLTCILGCLSVASAAPIPLKELIDTNGTMVNGDKEFSEFTYAATGNMPLAENVNVIPFQDAEGNFGLRFQGGFLDAPDPNDQASDTLITYRVRVTDPERLISGAHLAANLFAQDGGSATVTETFLPLFKATDEVLRIPSGGEVIDSIIFDVPQSDLVVQKNILMRATVSQVDLSFVDQTFSQVPEPSSAIVWLPGLACIVLRSRRRQSG